MPLVESYIYADFDEGTVVWKMTPDVAAFYGEELRRIQGADAGIRGDADALNDCAAQFDDGPVGRS